MAASIQNGTYRARCISNVLKRSKEKGTPSVNCQWELLFDLAHPGVPVKATVWSDLWLTANAFEKTLEVLSEVFDWRGENISDINNPDLFNGYLANLVIENETYNNVTRPRVKFVNAMGAKAKPLEDAQAKEIADKVLTSVRAYRARNKGKTGSRAVREEVPVVSQNAAADLPQNPVDESDLPF